MSTVPAELKYSESHEWVQDNGDGTVTIGITDHAQEALGDLVFVELRSFGHLFDFREPLFGRVGLRGVELVAVATTRHVEGATCGEIGMADRGPACPGAREIIGVGYGYGGHAGQLDQRGHCGQTKQIPEQTCPASSRAYAYR